MNKRYKIGIFGSGTDSVMEDVQKRRAELESKMRSLCERLAAIGATKASLDYAGAFYDGNGAVNVSVEPTEKGFKVQANGPSVLFIEFGSGAKYGGGHPEAGEFGYGPGTWSDGPNGNGHWDNPNGWWLPKSAGGGKSWGNPPAAAMYNARKEIEHQIRNAVKEVFGN